MSLILPQRINFPRNGDLAIVQSPKFGHAHHKSGLYTFNGQTITITNSERALFDTHSYLWNRL